MYYDIFKNNMPNEIYDRLESKHINQVLCDRNIDDIYKLINMIIYNVYEEMILEFVHKAELCESELQEKLIDSIYTNYLDSGINEDIILKNDDISQEDKDLFSGIFN